MTRLATFAASTRHRLPSCVRTCLIVRPLHSWPTCPAARRSNTTAPISDAIISAAIVPAPSGLRTLAAFSTWISAYVACSREPCSASRTHSRLALSHAGPGGRPNASHGGGVALDAAEYRTDCHALFWSPHANRPTITTMATAVHTESGR